MHHLHFKTIEDMQKFLAGFFVPIWSWGRGHSKTLENLFLQTQTGQSRLRVKTEKRRRVLVREVSYALVTAYYLTNGQWFRIIYHAKEFPGGTHKMYDLLMGIRKAVYVQKGEKPLDAAKRALPEELDYTKRCRFCSLGTMLDGTDRSRSFPGLPTVRLYHIYGTVVDPNVFKHSRFQTKEHHHVTSIIVSIEEQEHLVPKEVRALVMK